MTRVVLYTIQNELYILLARCHASVLVTKSDRIGNIWAFAALGSDYFTLSYHGGTH